MPFTVSHVAAVLPFARTPLIPAALAIGAMGPDLFTYLPLPVDREFAHSWLGMVTVDLACGIIVYLLWQLVFRRPVIDFAPLWVRSRMGPSDWKPTTRMRWVAFLLLLPASVLLGTATHIIWDNLTHPGAPGSGLPAMAALTTKLGPLTGYDWLQYLSSLAGALVLVWFVLRWARRTPSAELKASPISEGFRRAAWIIVAAFGVVVSVVLWVMFFGRGGYSFDPITISHFATSWIAGAGFAALVLCAVWGIRSARAVHA
jgi:hypothetical protein